MNRMKIKFWGRGAENYYGAKRQFLNQKYNEWKTMYVFLELRVHPAYPHSYLHTSTESSKSASHTLQFRNFPSNFQINPV